MKILFCFFQQYYCTFCPFTDPRKWNVDRHIKAIHSDELNNEIIEDKKNVEMSKENTEINGIGKYGIRKISILILSKYKWDREIWDKENINPNIVEVKKEPDMKEEKKRRST